MNLRYFLDDLWLDAAGRKGLRLWPTRINVEQLRRTEWSTEFETKMRNRLVMGAIRYGTMGHGHTPRGKPQYDRVKSIRKRLEFFERTGNGEWLVDIANMALLMYEERQHPNFHFNSGDDLYHDEIK